MASLDDDLGREGAWPCERRARRADDDGVGHFEERQREARPFCQGVRRTESVLVRASLARRGERSDGGGACRRPYARTVNFPREDRQFSVRSVLTRCVFSQGLPAKSFARHSDHGKLTVLKTQSLAESASGAR